MKLVEVTSEVEGENLAVQYLAETLGDALDQHAAVYDAPSYAVNYVGVSRVEAS